MAAVEVENPCLKTRLIFMENIISKNEVYELSIN